MNPTDEHRKLADMIAEIYCGIASLHNHQTKHVAELLAQYAADLTERVRAETLVELTFSRFSEINRQRCESSSGFNHKLESWSTSDWFLALFGELGEAANIAKKLNRFRDGIPGNKERKEELQVKLRQELGDSFVYLDLLSQSLSVAIGEAAVEVFNAKSQTLGCPIVIALGTARRASGK